MSYHMVAIKNPLKAMVRQHADLLYDPIQWFCRNTIGKLIAYSSKRPQNGRKRSFTCSLNYIETTTATIWYN